jgi:hypothetical protein
VDVDGAERVIIGAARRLAVTGWVPAGRGSAAAPPTMDSRALRPLARALALLGVVACAPAWAGGFAMTPYGALAVDLLERLHAEEVVCPVDLEAAAVCFVVEPGRAAPLAETLEAFVLEGEGRLERGDWRSGNGAHRVTIAFDDDPWGGLEVWFAESGDARVEGRLEHVLRRRD